MASCRFIGDTGSMLSAPACIFDLDGTLTDSKPGMVRCLRSALEAAGILWEGDLDWFIGPPIETSITKLMPNAGDADRNAVIRAYREHYDISGWSENALYPGIAAVLAELKAQGMRLFVCTSKREKFAVRVLQAFGLDAYFEATYADRGDRPHSKSELLRELLHARSLDSFQSVMIGDRRFDIEAAHENGLYAVAVTYGYGALEELSACAPDGVVEQPSEIPDAVRLLLGQVSEDSQTAARD